MELSWADVCGRRMVRQGLAGSFPVAAPAEAASAMCGAHAQVMSAAEVSLALRCPSATRTDVQDALWSHRSLVKTFGPRGTVHLLPADELALWCGALMSVPPAGRHAPNVRLSAEQTDELVAAMGKILADAELTVDELDEALADQVGAWAVERVVPAFQEKWPRWRQMVETAAHRGALCFGANKGRKTTYTSPTRWIPGFSPTPSDEAVPWLLDRYLHAYGPATPQHFARWLATTTGWAKPRFETAELTEVTVEGECAFAALGDVDPGPAPRGVRLLPYFDAFTIASQPRERLFPGQAAQRALANGQAGNFPVLLIDGIVAGVWHQKKTSTRITVTVEPLTTLTAPQLAQLDEQVERVAAIQHARPTLTIGPVSTRAHA
ncbi:winged helix DNA-binding domain-containing protein [Streptomyces spectabilis]|uniref:winged helix DNA-binding domain-containing protein n=1 Tax=Streptomyces spectabilis TaxID=68270 RepID=UPI0033D61689